MAVRISPGLLATHGRSDAGRRWLERLPFLVAEAERRFGVRAVEPFETHIAYVAAASPDSVLKVNFPDEESEHESHALELAAGDGTVRLLARDDELRALLLERLEPGKTLWTVPEAEANPIAARVLSRFWRPVAPDHPFRRLADEASRWAEQMVPEWDAGGRPFPRGLAEEAASLARELSETIAEEVLLHQDFHGGNVLASGDEWIAIDPKPVAGERAFDVASLLRDRRDELARDPNPARRVARRFAQLAEALELDRERMRGWGIVHTLAWGFEDGRWLDEHVACARWLAEIRP